MYLSLRDEALSRQDQARLARYGVAVLICPSHEAARLSYDQHIVDEAEGFILTSQQAADALPLTRTERPVYTVGRASAYAARQAGYQNVKWGPSDGKALAEMIATDLQSAQPVLCWLRAKEISFDIKAALGRAVTEQQVYEMRPQTQIPEDVAEALAQAVLSGTLAGIMVLSKAQLHCFVQLLQGHELWQAITQVPVFAVSPAVAEAATQAGFAKTHSARRKRAISVQAAVICHHRQNREAL